MKTVKHYSIYAMPISTTVMLPQTFTNTRKEMEHVIKTSTVETKTGRSRRLLKNGVLYAKIKFFIVYGKNTAT